MKAKLPPSAACLLAARFAVFALALLALSPLAQAQSSRYLPEAISRGAVSLGSESPTAVLRATVWLKLQDRSALDAAVEQLYTPGSPSYRHWLSASAMKRFMPTAAEVASVRAELAAHHLSVVAVDQENLAVTFTGLVSDFESAFHTQIERYRIGSATLRVALREPLLAGEADGLVSAVTGFEGVPVRSYVAVPHDVRTGRQIGIRPMTGAQPDGAYYSSHCVNGLTTVALSGPDATKASYTGFAYGADPTNTAPGTIAPCGYSPQDVWSLYGLNGLYKLGVQGAGQTVVIVDPYGSPTLTADVTTFSTLYGLPVPTPTSLRVYEPTPFTATNAGWAQETTLDVEWAHAIAPTANLALVAASTANDSDLQAAVLFAIHNRLGNVISNSYGSPESQETPAALRTWDQIDEMAAAQGISVQYASGDEGDFVQAIGRADVSAPADSVYATAVGGTSVAFSPLAGFPAIQTGWGTNLVELSASHSTVQNPPYALGFQFGSGGGLSRFFAKPGWQSALAGAGRHIPDIAAIADPYTGVEIILTISGVQYIEVIGGTSLAAPVFSAMWALGDEYSGASQGQAAPVIAAGVSTLIDITAPNVGYDTTGSITTAAGTTNYSAAALAQPLQGNTGFGSALWNYGGGAYYNVTFGTDSSLTVGPGWDPVTGYGTPSFVGLPQ